MHSWHDWRQIFQTLLSRCLFVSHWFHCWLCHLTAMLWTVVHLFIVCHHPSDFVRIFKWLMIIHPEENFMTRNCNCVITLKIVRRLDSRHVARDIRHFILKTYFHILIARRQNAGKTWRSRRNGCHLGGDIGKCISVNENDCVLIKVSLKRISNGSINDKWSLG